MKLEGKVDLVSPDSIGTVMDYIYTVLKLICRKSKQTNGARYNKQEIQGMHEYLLSKLSTVDVNGPFSTPRHIIRMMVYLMGPVPDEVICENCTPSLIRAAAA